VNNHIKANREARALQRLARHGRSAIGTWSTKEGETTINGSA